jgi:hypothetical protein
VEGLHTVGGIISKISINCVLIYMMCIYTCVYVYGFFLCMLHVYFYYYFHMNMCICRICLVLEYNLEAYLGCMVQTLVCGLRHFY